MKISHHGAVWFLAASMLLCTACSGGEPTTTTTLASQSTTASADQTDQGTTTATNALNTTENGEKGTTMSQDGNITTTTTSTTKAIESTASALSKYDTEYLKTRGGLNNTYARLTKDKKLTVAYIGGSITAGASASNAATLSYRPLTTAWLQKTFPDAQITEINMGTGSAGSKFPTYYVDADVIPQKPDLVFLECAINDYLENRVVTIEEVSIQYETVIRKILKSNPTCEFVALYTTDENVSATVEYFEQAKAQDEVAAHYDIPSINIGRRLRVEKNLLKPKIQNQYIPTWKVYFADTVHPTDRGHALYADYIAEYLKLAFDEAKKTGAGVINKTMPAAKNSTLLMNTQYIKTTNVDLAQSKNWYRATGEFYGTTKYYIYTNNAYNELVITFTGSSLTLNCSGLGWHDTVKASYSVDGGEWNTLNPNAIREVEIVRGLKHGAHTLRLKIGDNTAKNTFKIGGFMIH